MKNYTACKELKLSNKILLEHVKDAIILKALDKRGQADCSGKPYKPWHGMSNNVACATSNGSDQPAHTRSLIRAIASPLDLV